MRTIAKVLTHPPFFVGYSLNEILKSNKSSEPKENMSISIDDLKKHIQDFEGKTVDCKSHRILSHVDDLAELMVAFGNNKFVSTDYGGRIIIGVDNQKNVESFQAKQGHEELIMNVARDKCYPSINPHFETVDLGGQTVYVVTIPKMTNVPYQLITKQGKTFRIRVGSTIREPTMQELGALFDKTEPSSDSRLSLIVNTFPTIQDSFVQITVIPLDLNSRIISFDESTVSWLYSNQPMYADVSDVKVVQNEFHYKGTGPHKKYAIINDSGVYSYRETIGSGDKIIDSGRQVVLLLSICRFIKSFFHKYGYRGRVYVNCSYSRVENFKLGSSDAWEAINYEGYTAQKPNFTIERTISFDSMDCKMLTNSIFEELARACNGIVNSGMFGGYVSQLSTKYLSM